MLVAFASFRSVMVFMIAGLGMFGLTQWGCVHQPDLRTDINPIVIDTTGNDTTNNGGNDTTNQDPCDPDTVYFENDILPIIVSSCAKSGCHDAQSHKEGVILTDYSKIIQTGKVRAFRPDNSELWEVIVETDPEKIMPPPGEPQLSSEQKNMIRKWIEQGALNNKCNSGCDTANVTFSGRIQPLINKLCVNCHSGTAPQGGVSLKTYNDVRTAALNQSLLGSIQHSSGYSPMPKGGKKLSDCEIHAVEIWVKNGAPQN